MIELKDITKYFILGENKIQIINDLSFHVEKGDFLIVRGPSGSGKTTLLKLIAGLTKPSHGSLFVSRNNLAKKDQEQLALFRAAYIGFVFQDFHLIQILTCLENAMLPLELSGSPSEEARVLALEQLKNVGLENRINHLPAQLSGGELQRVSFARALVNNPSILIADEPTTNLDLKTSNRIVSILKNAFQEISTIVVATHDPKIYELGTCFIDFIMKDDEREIKFSRISPPRNSPNNKDNNEDYQE